MRSGLIFSASLKVPNRYLLCRLVSACTNKYHRGGASTQQTINESLTLVESRPNHSSGPLDEGMLVAAAAVPARVAAERPSPSQVAWSKLAANRD